MNKGKPRVMFWNARNLLSKLSEFKNLIFRISPHIIGVCETWLSENTSPKIQNYNIIRKDRTGNRGGGLAFIVRKDVKFSPLPLNNFQEGNLEVLALKIAFEFGWGKPPSILQSMQKHQKRRIQPLLQPNPLPTAHFR